MVSPFIFFLSSPFSRQARKVPPFSYCQPETCLVLLGSDPPSRTVQELQFFGPVPETFLVTLPSQFFSSFCAYVPKPGARPRFSPPPHEGVGFISSIKGSPVSFVNVWLSGLLFEPLRFPCQDESHFFPFLPFFSFGTESSFLPPAPFRRLLRFPLSNRGSCRSFRPRG